MNWNRSLILAAVAAPLALAGSSLAQPAGAPPAGGPPPREMRMQRPDPAAVAEKHAQMLRDVLQLRPEQEGALKALIEATKPPEGMAERMDKGREEEAGLTTPQRLDRMLARMDEHRAMMARHAEAVKRFYAQLSAGQQKAFDALHAGLMGHGMGMGEHHMIEHHMMSMGAMDLPPMDHFGMDLPDSDAPAGPPPG